MEYRRDDCPAALHRGRASLGEKRSGSSVPAPTIETVDDPISIREVTYPHCGDGPLNVRLEQPPA